MDSCCAQQCAKGILPVLALRVLIGVGLIITLPVQALALQDSLVRTRLSGEVELVRLVDLCAQRLQIKIEYDVRTLAGQKVTLRLGASVTDDELWALTNQLLTTRGLTSVQPPGSEAVLSIVKLTDAATLARIEQTIPPNTLAGFVSVILQPKNRQADDIIASLKPVLSKVGGSITKMGDDDRILLSDVRPRIDQILWLLEKLDVPGVETIIRIIPAQFISATQLASSVTATAIARNVIATKPLVGKLSPQANDSAVVLVAPATELEIWLELLEQFDQRQEVDTRSYTPRYFSLDEVAQLIEQTAKDTSPRGSGEQWRVISDDLSGTLIVTATPSEHKRIEELMNRLDEVPVEARRPVRTFAIRNRSVSEIVDVLSQLIDAGILEGGAFQPGLDRNSASSHQRSNRDAGESENSSTGTIEQIDNAPIISRTSLIEGEPSLVLTSDEGTNSIIAIGDARRLDQLEQLIGELDVRQPQVMIEVLIVSLTDGQTLDLGVELEKLQISGNTLITLSSLFGLGVAGIPSAIDAMTSGGGSGFSGTVISPGDFRVLVRALETLNEGRALNIPVVLVNNNQQATLDSVLQAPFLSVNASNTTSTTSFGGTQDAGTTVTITPQIAKGDHLILEYSVSLSTFVGESSSPGLPPPRQQTNLQSVVTIPDGFTIAVGGIEIVNAAEAVTQIPLLSSIPIIGEVFKNRSKSSSRSRFYVFIRANVLRHDGFEDLKYISEQDVIAAGIDDGWPEVYPRVIH